MNKHLKHLLFVFIIFLLAANCSDPPAKRDLTISQTVEQDQIDSIIHIKSKSSSPYSFYYINGIKGRPLNVPPEGSLEIKTAEPIFLIETYEQSIYYLKPGDSVVFQLKDKLPVFMYADSAKSTGELSFFRKTSDSTGCLRPLGDMTYLTARTTLEERDRIIDSVFHLRCSILSQALNEGRVSTSFYTIARRTFDFCKVHEKLSLYYMGYNKKDLRSFYKDSIGQYKKILSVCDINNPIYTKALLHLVRSQVNEANNTRPAMFFSGLSMVELKEISKLAEDFIPCNKSYINGTAVLAEMVLARKMGAKIALPKMIDEISDDNIKNQLIAEYQILFNRHVNPADSLQILTKIDSTHQSYNGIISSNSGQPIFIDNWAIWCVPCISGLPATRKLSETYKGKLKVLYFSFDEEYEQWRSFSQSNNLGVNSYLVDGAFLSNYAQSIKLKAIPRFVLLDEKGVIITDDAPRPGDPKLDTLLSSVLKQ